MLAHKYSLCCHHHRPTSRLPSHLTPLPSSPLISRPSPFPSLIPPPSSLLAPLASPPLVSNPSGSRKCTESNTALLARCQAVCHVCSDAAPSIASPIASSHGQPATQRHARSHSRRLPFSPRRQADRQTDQAPASQAKKNATTPQLPSVSPQ